jgi:hypothetical protein
MPVVGSRFQPGSEGSIASVSGVPFVVVSSSTTYDGSNFGAFTKGSTTSGQQEAFNSIASTGGAVWYRHGTFLTNSPVTVPATNGVVVLGCGSALGAATSHGIPTNGTVVEFTASCSGTDGFTFGGNVVTGFAMRDIHFVGAQTCPLTNSLVNLAQPTSQSSQVNLYNVVVNAIPMLYNATPPAFSLVMDSNSDSVLNEAVTVGAPLSWAAGGGSGKLMGGKIYAGFLVGGQTLLCNGTTFSPGNVTGALAWSSSTSYIIGNVVTLSGSSYVCIANNSNETPPNATYWTALSSGLVFAAVCLTNTVATTAIEFIGCYFDAAYSNYFSSVGVNAAQAGANVYNCSGRAANLSIDGGRHYGTIGNGPNSGVSRSPAYFYSVGQTANAFVLALRNSTFFADSNTWNSATAYVVGNVVTNGGLYYQCILGNTNEAPPNATYWTLITGSVPLVDTGVATHSFVEFVDVQFQNGAYYSTTLSTTGLGVANIVAATYDKAETGSADTNLFVYTPPTMRGTYRITITCEVTGTPSAGIVEFKGTYTDSEGNTRTGVAISLFELAIAAPALSFTLSAGSVEFYTTWNISTDASAGNIKVTWTGGGTITANCTVIAERVR